MNPERSASKLKSPSERFRTVTEPSRIQNRSLRFPDLERHDTPGKTLTLERRALSESPLRSPLMSGGVRSSNKKTGQKRLKFRYRSWIWIAPLSFSTMAILLVLDFEFSRFVLPHVKSRHLPNNDTDIQYKEKIQSSGDHLPPFLPMYPRLLAMAAHHLAEETSESQTSMEKESIWMDSRPSVEDWKPCPHKTRPFSEKELAKEEMFIMATLEGGLSQKRIGICNAVAIAKLFGASLVLPRFMPVANDTSEFGDVFDVSHFVSALADDVNVVLDLPSHLKLLNLQAIGSLVSDHLLPRQALLRSFLVFQPALRRNHVLHFLGFKDRLASDPVPSHIQKLRCRCNFHALRFTPAITRMSLEAIQRIRQGPWQAAGGGKYVAVFLRFEPLLAALSMCRFGGGDAEWSFLSGLRRRHFPRLHWEEASGRLKPPHWFRNHGLCPLTPEEAVLLLVSAGLPRQSSIVLAGAPPLHSAARLALIRSLFPNALSLQELCSSAPHCSSPLAMAAMDFLVCAEADLFFGTDLRSRAVGLIGGHRMYFGGRARPFLAPRKGSLAQLFNTQHKMEWEDFVGEAQDTLNSSLRQVARPYLRSVYRHPRCPDCMCEEAAQGELLLNASQQSRPAAAKGELDSEVEEDEDEAYDDYREAGGEQGVA